MSNKLFIIRRTSSAKNERLIEARSRRRVEGAILQDYEIVAVKGTNASEALAMQAKGVGTEKLED